ncbi:phage/plasmid replication protein, II/X family [Providencia manganoxydans]|uniref:phage/plasmid replication protein, II/X family n=1 Tax=Providencia manganoxydans TaxID=2923283 RepID=UPI0034E6137F
MIDWTSFVAPCFHSNPISNGIVLSINSSGETEWETRKAYQAVGSHDSSVRIKTVTVNEQGQGTHIYVDGNPIKFIQGHNLFGTDNLHSLLYGFLSHLCQMPDLCLSPTDLDRERWTRGDIELSRVDCTYMFDVGSPDNANAWIRQAEQYATFSHRGKGQIGKGSTLYFGKHSRRSALKFYPKGEEFKKHAHPDFLLNPSLLDYANKSLRAEAVIRSMELKRLNLNLVKNWDTETCSNLVNYYLKRLNMSEVKTFSSEKIDNLKPSLLSVYTLWKEGRDLRGMYSKAQFYRYRKALMDALSIDISVLPVSESIVDSSNVVHFIRITEAKPMGIPDWAYGTDLYYDPPALKLVR